VPRERWTRRKVLERTSLGLGAALVPIAGALQRPADVRFDRRHPDFSPADTGDTGLGVACVETPADVQGPFYVAGVPVREDLDLYGDAGPRLTLDGVVLDTACAPIEAAVVEIWHVGPNGNYDNHSPEMRYRGQTSTAADGSYHFHTLMPVYYGVRPLHVHLKVWIAGVEKLTTQIYFDDDPVAAGQDPALIIPRTLVGSDYECVFDVVVTV